MAGTPARRASDGAVFHARIGVGRAWLAAVVPILLLIALVLAQARALAVRPVSLLLAGAPADLTPPELTELAATVLEAATADGGAGYTFTVVQRTSLDARPGGPLIDIPDPIDRGGSLGKTDHYELATYIERGAVTPAGFWLEIRSGPEAGKEPDFETADYQLGAIVRDGVTYRNDGDGWYPTEDPPGIGLDPRTAALLPTMLRAATDTKDAEPKPGAETARDLEATSKVADLPGLIAVDAESFTEFIGPLELGFDDLGRLVTIHGLARNTNLDEVDMLVDTVITLTYPLLTPEIPKPDPIIDPDQGEG